VFCSSEKIAAELEQALRTHRVTKLDEFFGVFFGGGVKVYFVQFFKACRSGQNFWVTFSMVNVAH
jgi:hypothetical protein